MTYTIYRVKAKLHGTEIIFGVYSKKLQDAINLAKDMFLNTHNIILADDEFEISSWGE